MRHKYLPRMRGVVLGLVGGAAAGVAAACGDPTGAGAHGPKLLLTLDIPPSDSLGQLGVALFVARSDSAPLREVRVYVDSAAGVEPANASDPHCGGLAQGKVYWASVVLPGPGRHTVTVVGVDSLGHALDASAAWTVRVPGESYAVTPLPDSGVGGGTRFVHANGTVAGWVGGRNGRRRPALWRGGVLTVPGVIDSLDGVATRVNMAGDVLLEYSRDTVLFPGGPHYPVQRSVRVRRADGLTLAVGPNVHVITAGGRTFGADTTCCGVGADLTESRLALGASPNTPDGYGNASAVLDVVRGTRADSMDAMFVALNEAGQGLGTYLAPGLHQDRYLIARGFQLSDPPTEGAQIGKTCNPHAVSVGGRVDSRLSAIDLDESANVLAWSETTPFWSPTSGGQGRWLDRVVGQSKAIHLSRRGQIVASLDSAGAIYLWRPATNRTTQVQIAGSAWRIDSLAAVNASGQIAAHGVERATGRAAALLLTPAP